jgi:hypothetical protein
MSRFVTPQIVAGDRGGRLATANPETLQDKLERVAKYVPSEVVATFLFLNGGASTVSTHNGRLVWFGLSFFACLICTPLYFGWIARAEDPKRLQQIVSTTAFLVWAYALGAGFFMELDWYRPVGAIFSVGLFSLVSAFIVPKRQAPENPHANSGPEAGEAPASVGQRKN